MKFDYTPSERWKAMNADAAWKNVVRSWRDKDIKRNLNHFMQSVSQTLHMEAEVNYGTFRKDKDNCGQTEVYPKGADGTHSGPAAHLIWKLADQGT
jgi:hypothetical protein